MKLLFYNHTGKVSGAERMLLMILAGLDRDRFETVLLCPAEDSLAALARDAGVQTKTCHTLQARFTLRPDFFARYLLSFWRVIYGVRKSVIEIDPDLVHANSIRAGIVATAATLGLGTRVVWHLHDLLPRHPFSTPIRIFAFLFARARMIAVSKAVADNFGGRLFSLRNRVSVIFNGIEIERFKPLEGSREITRRELALAESDFVVGIVGLLTPRKGQLGLIQSFAKALEEVPQAKLLIVGSPVFNKDEEYADLLKRTVQRLGIADRVLFLGSRNDVPALMQSIDLLIVNSSVEPFGLVLLEAMACGAPVLAAISGGIPELIDHSRNGWLVKHGDTQELTEAIVKISQVPEMRRQVAEAGRRHVVSRFSSNCYLRELEEFYSANGELNDALGRQAAMTSLESRNAC